MDPERFRMEPGAIVTIGTGANESGDGLGIAAQPSADLATPTGSETEKQF